MSECTLSRGSRVPERRHAAQRQQFPAGELRVVRLLAGVEGRGLLTCASDQRNEIAPACQHASAKSQTNWLLTMPVCPAVCTDVSSCPAISGDGERLIQPTACPVQRLVPNAEELRKGKVISCDCGGDTDTQLLCSVRTSSTQRPHHWAAACIVYSATALVAGIRVHIFCLCNIKRIACRRALQMLPETRILINITQDGDGPLQKGHVKCASLSVAQHHSTTHASEDFGPRLRVRTDLCFVAVRPRTGCTRECPPRTQTQSQSTCSTPTQGTGKPSSPGELRTAHALHTCAEASLDARRSRAQRATDLAAPCTRCAWSQRSCQDPLPSSSQCLFLTVRGRACAA